MVLSLRIDRAELSVLILSGSLDWSETSQIRVAIATLNLGGHTAIPRKQIFSYIVSSNRTNRRVIQPEC